MGRNREWNTTKLRYNYQSPITPTPVYDFQRDYASLHAGEAE